MRTLTKKHLMHIVAVSFILCTTSPGWAENLAPREVVETGTADEMNKCETGDEPSALALQVASEAASPGGQPSGGGLKIVSIDPVQGKVTAQSIATGKILYFHVAPGTLKKQNLRVGQTIDVGFIVANGIQKPGEHPCPCGQHQDGSCWDCKDGVKGRGGPTFETPGGTGGRPGF